MELENTSPTEMLGNLCPLSFKKGWIMNNLLVYINKYLVLECRFGNRGLFNVSDTKSKSCKLYLGIYRKVFLTGRLSNH